MFLGVRLVSVPLMWTVSPRTYVGLSMESIRNMLPFKRRCPRIIAVELAGGGIVEGIPTTVVVEVIFLIEVVVMVCISVMVVEDVVVTVSPDGAENCPKA